MSFVAERAGAVAFGDANDPSKSTPGLARRPIRVRGTRLVCDGEPITMRGVTYGTFRPRDDGGRYPGQTQVRNDFDAIRGAGFNAVRTYTAPPPDVLEEASAAGLWVLAGAHTTDLRYLVGASKRQRTQAVRDAADEVAAMARNLRDNDVVAAICLGNELPADVVRWFGPNEVERTIERLAASVREIDDTQLVTYGNYPSTEHLELPTLDFLTVNIFLDRPDDFDRYVLRLQNIADGRPLVIGELGAHVADTDGETRQAELVRAQLERATRRGVAGTFVFAWTDEWHVGDAPIDDWRFGLTTADRRPRPALHAVSEVIASARAASPAPARVSVIVCARNESQTMAECLSATTSLTYPNYEVIVVDDGSTDDTAAIAATFPTVRTVGIPHSGLGAARNAGFAAATGSIIAYLDADAYPDEQWLDQLVRGFDHPRIGAVGGPNLVPPEDSWMAQAVGLAPGGPAHVLVADDRAEHVPGCNMAFTREALLSVGAFDPAYRSAGDDVDVCWKVLDRHYEIAFRPDAVVFHHRRGSVRAYFKQQRGYGRAETLVAARHPERFNRLGTIRWRGHIYGGPSRRSVGDRVYGGPFGTAAFQSVYRANGHALGIAHQLGVPLAVVALPVAALSAVAWPPALALVAFIVLGLAALFAVDVHRVPRSRHGQTTRFRMVVAALHLIQPIARQLGRRTRAARTSVSNRDERLPGPVTRAAGGVLVFPCDRSRRDFVPAVMAVLRSAGIRVRGATAWDDHDCGIVGSFTIRGELVTSCHPHGAVQVRIRRRLRLDRIAAASSVALVAMAARSWTVAAAILAMTIVDGAIGILQIGSRCRGALLKAAA